MLEELDIVLTSMSDAVVMLDRGWRYIYVNDRAAEIAGMRKEALMGRVAWEVFPELVGSELETRLRHAMVERTNAQFEYSHPPGERWFENRIHPTPRGLVIFTQDITERKRAELALRISEERFRTALRDAPVSVFNQDEELRYTWIHNSAPGFRAERVLGKRDSELLERTEDAHRVETLKRQVLQTGMGLHQEVCLQIEGQERYYDLTLEPLRDEAGQVRGITGAGADVTERMQLQARLHEQAQRLMEADQRKDMFLAMLAHELRNPLAPIQNAVQLLRRQGEPLAPKLYWATDVIARQVKQMARLIDDLLDVARLTRDRIELRKTVVNIEEVISTALESVHPFIQERGHHLVVALPPDPLYLEADPARLAQAIGNLLHNAAKYTEAGGQIRVSARRQGDQLVLRVRDTGMGIAAEMLPQVFDLFTQADRSLHRQPGGLGLGLTLVRCLVELHGGRVEASSEGLGRGSEFSLYLPALAEEVAQAAPEVPAGTAEPATRRVLVVDDNPDIAVSFAELLRMLGHEVRAVYDGPTALDTAQGFRPEVVFLDIGLPGMNGYEVARRLRAEHTDRHMLLVAMTGYGQDEARRRSAEAGFNHHLLKPVTLESIEGLLAEAAPPQPAW